jgi:hypothetical protein
VSVEPPELELDELLDGGGGVETGAGVGLAVGVTGAAETGVELTGAGAVDALEDGDETAGFERVRCFFADAGWRLVAGWVARWWAAPACLWWVTVVVGVDGVSVVATGALAPFDAVVGLRVDRFASATAIAAIAARARMPRPASSTGRRRDCRPRVARVGDTAPASPVAARSTAAAADAAASQALALPAPDASVDAPLAAAAAATPLLCPAAVPAIAR